MLYGLDMMYQIACGMCVMLYGLLYCILCGMMFGILCGVVSHVG